MVASRWPLRLAPAALMSRSTSALVRYSRARTSALRTRLGGPRCGSMVARLGVAAKLGFKAHPHMFRHACGFQLANQGTDTRTLQAYLGHRNIQHTVRYTELSPARRTSTGPPLSAIAV